MSKWSKLFRNAILCLLLINLFIKGICFAGESSTEVQKLSLNLIEALIKEKMPDKAISGEIRQRGLDFVPDANSIHKLRLLGAGPMTIEALYAFCPWLREAEKYIPGILKDIFQALDRGNPSIIRDHMVPQIASDSQKLDSICVPFRYRAHYIEAIIERPNRRFFVRTRVLLNPLEENALLLKFMVEEERFVLEDVFEVLEMEGSEEYENWFRAWKISAEEIARKFYYALKANRADVISTMRTSDQITFRPIFKYMELDASEIKDKINPDSIETEIVSNKGIKIRVSFDICEDTWLMVPCTKCSLYIDIISNEYKIVGWEANNPWKMTPKPSEFDANMEYYTLKRFGLISNEQTNRKLAFAALPAEQKASSNENKKPAILRIEPIAVDYSDGTIGHWTSSFPNPAFDDSEGGWEPDMGWTANVYIEGNILILEAKNIWVKSIAPPINALGIGYKIVLKNALFEDGSNEKSFIIYKYYGGGMDEVIKTLGEKKSIQIKIPIKIELNMTFKPIVNPGILKACPKM